MTVQALKANFTRGEVTPLVHVRTDTEFFKAAAGVMRGWVTLRYGGMRRRSGLRYRGVAKFDDRDAVFIPFVFSSTQSYMLEFGDLYVRFWTPEGLRVVDGLGDPYEVVTPYTAAQVERVQWAQDSDVLYLAHPDHPPAALTRAAHATWSYAVCAFLDGPYLAVNDTAVTLTPSGSPTTGGTITITMSSATPINRGLGLLSTDVGRHVRMQIGGNYSWGIIQTVPTNVTATVLIKEGNGGGTTPSITWRFGAFSNTTGWPGSVSFVSSRLAWGRTNSNPNGVGLSRSGLPLTYAPTDPDGTVVDSHGLFYDIRAAGEIVWLKEANGKLQVGTLTHIRTLGASSGDEVITPRNVQDKPESNTASVAVPPVSVGPSTVHAGRFGRVLHDLFFDYNINSLSAPPLSTLSEHMFKRGIRRLAYAQTPDSVIWVCTEDGNLCGTTFDREERVVGFHRHPQTNGTIECIGAVPSATEKRDVLFSMTKRTIDGNEVRYVETLEQLFDGELEDKEDAFFVDCGVKYDGVAVGTVTGLGHLEGETVDILADGSVYPQQEVVGGEVTLPDSRTASKYSIGLPIECYGETLTPVVEKSNGSTIGDKQRPVFVIVSELEALGLKVGPVGGLMETVRFRDPTALMGSSSDLHTGTAKVPIEGGWQQGGLVAFECTQPLPATIRGLNIAVDV